MHTATPTICILTLTAALAACTPDRDTADEARTASAAATAAAQPLPEGVIQQLAAEYPVLRSERAPEPRPSPEANPAQVPERVRGAVAPRVLRSATGGATFYANKFEGRHTASGIPFRQNQMVAAHRSYPFGTLLRVTNLGNDESVNVRVVDRGPFGSQANRRRTMVDLSRRAATQLGFTGAGRAQVRVEVLEWGDGIPRVS